MISTIIFPPLSLQKWRCNKEFTRKDNLLRHEENRCKMRNIESDEIIKLKNIIKNQSEQIDEIKTILIELLNKRAKIHPKTLQKINKQLTGDNK
jgi:hypothetical protein